MTLRPLPSVTLTGFYSYTSATYNAFVFNIAAHPDGSGSIPINDRNAPFAGVPAAEFGFGARYDLPVPERLGEMDVQADYYHQSSLTWTDNSEPGGFSPGYGLLDLRYDWRAILGHKLDVSVWAKNVTDQTYKAYGASTLFTLGYQAYIPGRPRTIGVNLKAYY